MGRVHMHKPAHPMSPATLRSATHRAHSKVQGIFELAQALTEDVHQAIRHARHYCKACFYGPPRLGGAAMTTQPCMCCGTPQQYNSTNTDALCEPCAQKHRLCKHCGGDIDMDVMRVDWPMSAPPASPPLA